MYKIFTESPENNFLSQLSWQQTSREGFFYSSSDSLDLSKEELKKQCQTRMHEGISTALVSNTFQAKAVFFDMDSTVIAQESIVELARVAGKSEEVHRITEEAMEGGLDFDEALRKRVAFLKGLSTDIYRQVGDSLTVNPGIAEFCKDARNSGVRVYMVSGGFMPLATFIGEKLGFNGVLANTLEEKGGY